MRHKLILPALALLLTLNSTAQTAEPEFADVFYRLDAGKLTSLERQPVRFQVNGRFMSAKVLAQFPGAQSPIRFSRTERLEFVVKTSSEIDPKSVYVLRKIDAKKKTREMILTTAHASPFGVSSKAPSDAIAVQFAKYGSSSLKAGSEPLAPGEYAVGRIHGEMVFCFGVD